MVHVIILVVYTMATVALAFNLCFVGQEPQNVFAVDNIRIWDTQADWANTTKANLTEATAPGSIALDYQGSIVNKGGGLPTPRSYTSAVWNPINNKAYIFGGYSSPTIIQYDDPTLDQIIEYDPANSSSIIKSEVLPSNRKGTSAIWNPVNNKAYIFGGINAIGYLNEIIEYDPATGTVTTKTEVLPSARAYTAAVWDPVNNKAYIFGGQLSSSAYTNQILEYDPATGAVTTKTEVLPSDRAYTSAVWDIANSKAYIFAGQTNQILEYDPALGSVTIKTEVLPGGQVNSESAVWDPVNSKAYILGGFSLTSYPYTSYFLTEYDPATGSVTMMVEQTVSKTDYTSAIWNPVNNKAYVFGGTITNIGSVDCIIEYSPQTHTVALKYLISNPANSSAVLNENDKKAYIFGGGVNLGTYHNQISVYDTITGTATIKPETLPSARGGTSAVWNPVNNKAYIFGGIGSSYLNQIIEYDPATGTVTTKTEVLPSARANTSAVWNPVNNKAYIFGGQLGSNTYTNQIIEYDPATGTVTTKAETLPSAQSGISAIWNPVNNKAYLFGGDSSTGTWAIFTNQILEYDPATGVVTTKTEVLPFARAYASTIWNSLKNKIYIFGGSSGGSSYSNLSLEYDPITGLVNQKSELLPYRIGYTSAVWNSTNNKAFIFGGKGTSDAAVSWGIFNQIIEYNLNSTDNYQLAGYAISNHDAGVLSRWDNLNKSDVLSSDNVRSRYYAKTSIDNTCPKPSQMGNYWYWTGWTQLTFNENSASLASLSQSQYLCIAAYLDSSNTIETPKVDSLTLSYTPTRTITVSGTVYGDEGTTPYNCSSDNLTIGISVKGGAPTNTTCSTANGIYSTSVTGIWSTGDPISVYIDGSETSKATVVTLAADSSSNIAGLDLYQNRLIIRHENLGSVTNANLATADNTNTGIRYSVASGNLTIESGISLYVWSGKSFISGGAITTNITGGDIKIANNGIFNVASNALSVGGSWNNLGTFTSTGTTTFTSTSAGKSLSGNMNGSSAFANVVFNGVGGSWDFGSNNTEINGTFTLTNGTVIAPSSLLVINSTFSKTGGVFNNNNGTIAFNVNSTYNITTGDAVFYDLVLNQTNNPSCSSYTIGFLSNFTVNHNMTVKNEDASSCGTSKYLARAAVYASRTITINGDLIFPITSQSSTLEFGNSSGAINTTVNLKGNLDVLDSGVSVFANLSYVDTTKNQTITKNAGTIARGNWTVNKTNFSAIIQFDLSTIGNVTLTSGTIDLQNHSLSAGAYSQANGTFSNASPNVTFSGNFTQSNGTFNAPSGTLSVAGNFSRTGGVFNHNNGTVKLSGGNGSVQTISGSTTFNNLTASTETNTSARTIRFTYNTTQTILGTWTVTGYSGKMITLQSSSSIINWIVNPSSALISYANVSRSTNNGVNICAEYSTNGGNNSANWSFSSGACGFDISGTIYSDEGNTSYDCSAANLNINISASGGANSSTACTLGNGSYSISGISAAIGSSIVVSISNTDSQKATTATLSSGADINNLDLYINKLILTHENPGSITNTLLATGSNGDAGIRYSVTENRLAVQDGIGLYLKSDKTFTPGGDIITSTNGGDVKIAANSVLDMAGYSLNIGGSWNNLGTYTSTGTTRFVSASTGKTLSGNMTGSSAFNNLIFDGVGGGWSFSNSADIKDDFTLLNGTVTAPSETLSVAGDLNYTGGTFNHNSGIVSLSGSDGSTQTISGNASFYDVNIVSTNMASGRAIKFAGGSVQNISGTFTAVGSKSNKLMLQSTNGANWFIDAAAASVSYVSVGGSTNIGNSFCATYSEDSGSNLSWNISSQETCALSIIPNHTPEMPSDLAQKKNDSIIPVGGRINGETITFTAIGTDPDEDDSLSLCVQKKPIGIALDLFEETCGAMVVYSGEAVAVSVPMSDIETGVDYHWQARLKDAAGNISPWVSFGNNSEAEVDFGRYIYNPVTPPDITPTPIIENQAPTALMAVPKRVIVGTEITLEGTDSSDDSAIASYNWELGDGSVLTGDKAIKRYDTTGEFEVKLTVVDDGDKKGVATSKIAVVPPPPVISKISRESRKLKTDGSSQYAGKITLYIHSDPIVLTVDTDKEGNWSADYSGLSDLDEGKHMAKATITDLNNMTSDLSDEALFIINSPSDDPFTEKILGTIDAIKDSVDSFIDDIIDFINERILTPEIRRVAQVSEPVVIVVALAATTGVTTATVGGFGLVNTLSYPYYLLLSLSEFLGIRRKRTPWGVIYDSITKKPLSLVIVRIYEANSEKLIDTSVTDKYGRYGFIAPVGSYYIKVTKQSYIWPSVIISNSTKADDIYQNIYHGETFSVDKESQAINYNSPIDPLVKEKSSKFISNLRTIRIYVKKYILLILVPALLLGVINIYISDNPLDIVASILLFLLILNEIRSKRNRFNWGIVYDSITKKPVRNAAVKIFDQNGVQKGTKITDKSGKFGFLVESGNYKITVENPDYSFPSKRITNKNDGLYSGVYLGEEFKCEYENPVISANIPLDPKS